MNSTHDPKKKKEKNRAKHMIGSFEHGGVFDGPSNPETNVSLSRKFYTSLILYEKEEKGV